MKKLVTILTAILLSATAFSQTYVMHNGSVVKHENQRVHNQSAYGSEMLSNGTFTGGSTDWTFEAVWSHDAVDDEMDYDDTNGGYLRQIDGDMVSSITTDTEYNLQFDITISSGNATLRVYNYNLTVLFVAEDDYADGSHSLNFTTPGTLSTAGFLILARDASDNAWSIDNISLREVL